MQPCLSSSSNGLHTGQRVLTPASTSSSRLPLWRYPAPRHHQSSSQYRQQQQCWSSPEDSQAFRFKHKYNPQQLSPDLGSSSWFGWPLKDGERATGIAGEGTRLDPEQTFWSSTGGPQDAVQLRNPWASKFRVSRVPMPVPVSLPGSEYWHVEMLNNYSTNWPSLKFVDGKLQFRKGFLEPFDDPKVGGVSLLPCTQAAASRQLFATQTTAGSAGCMHVCWAAAWGSCGVAAAADSQQHHPRLTPAHSCAVPLSQSPYEAQGGWAWEQKTWYVTARCTAHLAARLLYSRHTFCISCCCAAASDARMQCMLARKIARSHARHDGVASTALNPSRGGVGADEAHIGR